MKQPPPCACVEALVDWLARPHHSKPAPPSSVLGPGLVTGDVEMPNQTSPCLGHQQALELEGPVQCCGLLAGGDLGQATLPVLASAFSAVNWG